MKSALVVSFLFAMPLTAFAAQGRVVHLKDSTGTVLVIDNGEEVCRVAAGKECSWPMTDGLHTETARRIEDGTCFGGVFAVPTNIPDTVFGAKGINISPDPSMDSVSIWEVC